jgi:glycerol uptake facilitator-like aquaporin
MTGLYIVTKSSAAWSGYGPLMFELLVWQLSATARTRPGQWFAEAVATFGLGLTIFGTVAHAPSATPYAVGLYITSAYWFTASTSFANPAGARNNDRMALQHDRSRNNDRSGNNNRSSREAG